MITLDYETRSRAPLVRPKNRDAATVLDNPIRAGMHNYAVDASTSMLCAAIDEQLLTDPADVRRVLAQADALKAHNAAFERLVTKYVLGLDIPIERFRCTAAQARHANVAGDLAGACDMLGIGGAERKDDAGHKIMLRLSQPNPKAGQRTIRQKEKTYKVTKKWLRENPDSGYEYGDRRLVQPEQSYIEPEWIDDPALFDRLYAYCRQDVVAERALSARLPPLPEREQKLWELDRRINERGFPIDVDFCRGAIEILAQANRQVRRDVTTLTGGEATDDGEIIVEGLVSKGTQVARIKKFVNERGLNVDDLTADTVDAVLERADLPTDVRKMLHLRQSVSSAAVGKYGCALDMVCADGRLREGLMFYGASQTGRWTGPGFNPLNMKKGIALDERVIEDACSGDHDMFVALHGSQPIDTLGAMIRGIICAPPGRTFVDADSSQIELRLVHWLAGDEKMLDACRAGFDPYIGLYSKVYGVSPSEVTKDNRQFAKCLGADTKVLTNRGVKRITDVTKDDLLWDGVEWVRHDGLIYQGEKRTVVVDGVSMTPDHRILVGRDWQPASQVLDDGSLSRALATSLDFLQSKDTFSANGAGSARSWRSVDAGARCASTTTLYAKGSLQSVSRAAPESNTEDVSLPTPMWSRMRKNGGAYSTAFLPSFQGATTQAGRAGGTMAGAAYRFGRNGWKAIERIAPLAADRKGAESFSPTFAICPEPMIRHYSLIESTTIGGTSRAISGLFQRKKTATTNELSRNSRPVYDILNAGPRQRFCVITNTGSLIVHNCLALGMQYAMGVNRAMEVTGFGALETRKLIDAYRKGNPEVVSLWDRLTMGAILAIQRDAPVRVGKLVFEVRGDWLTMRLPSGRRLYYYEPRPEENKYGFPCVGFKSRRGRKQIGGGHLLENAAQATCRDLLCDWMLEMDQRRMEILFNVYDSILLECDKDAATETQHEVAEIMATASSWAQGLPLGVDAAVKNRFEK